jgi:hypothetical protein
MIEPEAERWALACRSASGEAQFNDLGRLFAAFQGSGAPLTVGATAAGSAAP